MLGGAVGRGRRPAVELGQEVLDDTGASTWARVAIFVVMLEGGRVVLSAPARSLTLEDVSSRMELTASP